MHSWSSLWSQWSELVVVRAVAGGEPHRDIAVLRRDREVGFDAGSLEDVAQDRCHAPLGGGGAGLGGGSRADAPPHLDVIAPDHDQGTSIPPVVDGLLGADERVGLETGGDQLGVHVVRQAKQRFCRGWIGLLSGWLICGVADGHEAFPQVRTGRSHLGPGRARVTRQLWAERHGEATDRAESRLVRQASDASGAGCA